MSLQNDPHSCASGDRQACSQVKFVFILCCKQIFLGKTQFGETHKILFGMHCPRMLPVASGLVLGGNRNWFHMLGNLVVQVPPVAVLLHIQCSTSWNQLRSYCIYNAKHSNTKAANFQKTHTPKLKQLIYLCHTIEQDQQPCTWGEHWTADDFRPMQNHRSIYSSIQQVLKLQIVQAP